MKQWILVSGFILTCAVSSAQDQPKKEIEELRFNLNDDETHYIKATILNQVWLRFNQSNPATTTLGTSKDQTFDIGLRRTRMQLFGQLTDHVGFYFQFGQNNFNYLAGQNANNSGNRKFQAFFHDALIEYKIKKNSDLIYLGAGLTIANGLSRFSQPGVSTIMSLDVPVFAQATVDQTDEFSRKLSLYARGQVGKLNYRIVVSDPFPVTSSGNVPSIHPSNATFAYNEHYKQFQGMLIWNFFDKEPMTTPYMTGTYLGKRRVLNLEAGFIAQKNATWIGFNNTGPTDYFDMNLWSVALYYDAPVNVDKGTALSAYAGFFHTDYGSRYLRYNGIMNPANGSEITGPTAPETPIVPSGSFGNSYPMFGTGEVIYAQAGYKLRNDLLGEGNGTLMPYITAQIANYDRIDKPVTVYDVGMNWLIKGHTSKISLDYQLRPTFFQQNGNLFREDGMKSQVTLQYQVFF